MDLETEAKTSIMKQCRPTKEMRDGHEKDDDDDH